MSEQANNNFDALAEAQADAAGADKQHHMYKEFMKGEGDGVEATDYIDPKAAEDFANYLKSRPIEQFEETDLIRDEKGRFRREDDYFESDKLDSIMTGKEKTESTHEAEPNYGEMPLAQLRKLAREAQESKDTHTVSVIMWAVGKKVGEMQAQHSLTDKEVDEIKDSILNENWYEEKETSYSEETEVESNDDEPEANEPAEEKDPLSELTGWARAKYYLDNPGKAFDRLKEKSKAAYYGFIPGVQEKVSNASKESKNGKNLVPKLILGGIAVAIIYDLKYGTDTTTAMAESTSDLPMGGEIDFSNVDSMGIGIEGNLPSADSGSGLEEIASNMNVTPGEGVDSATEINEAVPYVPLEVEAGNGFTHELRDIARENNILGLDSSDYMEAYKELESKLIAEVPSYLMDSGNYGISSPGTHAISTELYNEAVEVLKEKALGK